MILGQSLARGCTRGEQSFVKSGARPSHGVVGGVHSGLEGAPRAGALCTCRVCLAHQGENWRPWGPNFRANLGYAGNETTPKGQNRLERGKLEWTGGRGFATALGTMQLGIFVGLWEDFRTKDGWKEFLLCVFPCDCPFSHIFQDFMKDLLKFSGCLVWVYFGCDTMLACRQPCFFIQVIDIKIVPLKDYDEEVRYPI